LKADEDWELKGRMDGRVMKKFRQERLWNQISYAAWRCADPGLNTILRLMSGTRVRQGGEIRASTRAVNICSLTTQRCNLASANLMKFYDAEKIFLM
jgi:ribonucleoside-diphosphate reductase alpha chain